MISTKKQHAKCVCGQIECANITALYQDIWDQRGQFMQVPTTFGDTKHKGHKEKVEHVNNVFKNHLPILKTIEIFDKWQNDTKEIQEETNTKKKHQRQTAMIALHHFHPYVVNT